MIWQGRGKAGLIIISVLLLFSCENPNEIGLELNPDKNKVGFFFKELTLPVTAVNTDSLETDFSSRLLSGFYRDERFGSVKCIPFTQIGYDSNEIPSFTDSSAFDSLVFRFTVKYDYGPDLGFNQKYYLHHLEENLSDTLPYYTFSEIKFSELPIGENIFSIEPNIDTVLTIKINDEFGRDFFNTVTDTTQIDFKDLDEFIEYFKGLAMVPDESNNSVIGFDISDENTAMTLYYRNGEDTLNYDFILNDLTNFNQILSDRSGSILEPFDDLLYSEFLPSDEKYYLQAGTGLVMKVYLDPVVDFVDTIPDLIINAAYIVIPVKSYIYNVIPPEYINFYFTDSTNHRLKSGLSYLGIALEGTSDILSVPYVDSLRNYTGRVTLFTEDLVRDLHEYTQLLVYPSVFETSQSVNQMIVEKNAVKFRIYYTALK